MQNIPINDVTSQTVKTLLAGQSCKMFIYQLASGLYLDLYVNDVLIVGGVICENLNRIVRDLYLGFIGDLIFQDTQGSLDPSSPGLGTRYLLQYLEVADLNGLG